MSYFRDLFGSSPSVKNFRLKLLKDSDKLANALQELVLSTHHLRRFKTESFSHLDLEDIVNAIALGTIYEPKGFEYSIHFNKGDREERDIALKPNYSQIGSLLDAGSTLCITNIHLVHPALSEFIKEIQSISLNDFEWGVNCYISSHGHGANQHFDARHVSAVQLEGEKTWKFGTFPTLHKPYQNARVREKRVIFDNAHRDWERYQIKSTECSESTTLIPGDVLYLSPGVCHLAEAGTDTPSVSLNIYCIEKSASHSISGFLCEILLAKPHFRDFLKEENRHITEHLTREFVSSVEKAIGVNQE